MDVGVVEQMLEMLGPGKLVELDHEPAADLRRGRRVGRAVAENLEGAAVSRDGLARHPVTEEQLGAMREGLGQLDPVPREVGVFAVDLLATRDRLGEDALGLGAFAQADQGVPQVVQPPGDAAPGLSGRGGRDASGAALRNARARRRSASHSGSRFSSV